MSGTSGIELAKLPLWLLRMPLAPGVLPRFRDDPVLFAHWYALIGKSGALQWPEEVTRIQESQRYRKMSFDRTMSLLSRVSSQLDERIGVEFARDLLEGFEAHVWVAEHIDEMDAMVREACRRVEAVSSLHQALEQRSSMFGRRLGELKQALKLTRLEGDLLELVIACDAFREIRALVRRLVESNIGSFPLLWSIILGCRPSELMGALGPRGTLRVAGLVKNRSKSSVPEMPSVWLQLLASSSERSLLDSVLEPMPSKIGAGIPARLPDEDKALAAGILRRANCPGVNLLLYGAENLDNRAMLAELTGMAGVQPYLIRRDDAFSVYDYPTLAFVAGHLLAEQEKDAVLIIDRPLDVLERRPSFILTAVLGIEVSSSDIRELDEALLEDNPVPTVWVGASAESFSEEILARFIFHAKLQRASTAERKELLLKQLGSMRLLKKTEAAIAELGEVSALQLRAAKQAALLSGAATRREKEAALLQALRRSLAAMRRETKARAHECVTSYSLDFLHCAGRFGPEKIIQAFSRRPQGSLCLYGLPGTGKTQFVEHLAATLRIPLIARRASDLLSKYVGDNEKNIARMFSEAEAEGAILFLDEGDSFLRDRSSATAEWEVTKVNELLQHMERFNGIFIVATNLFRGLDQAALRRFTFKLEFLPLRTDQRLRMFLREAGLANRKDLSAEQLDAWHTDLALMHNLTAGDFATVKRQSILLDEPLTPDQWIEQLRIECDVKAGGAS